MKSIANVCRLGVSMVFALGAAKLAFAGGVSEVHLRSIDPCALRAGDILISTTDAPESNGIRRATRSPVSHAALYLGAVPGRGGQVVIEAQGEGVRVTSLEEALANDTLAVALRHPALDGRADRVGALTEFALGQEGKPYNRAVVADFLCRASGLERVVQTIGFLNDVVRSGPVERLRGSFYCSELIDRAFACADIDLVPGPTAFPDDFRVVTFTKDLVYVGHLRAAE